MKSWYVASLAALSMLAASAHAENVNLSATLTNSCVLTVGSAGVMAASTDGTRLGSEETGGSAATLSVVAVGTLSTVNFSAPSLTTSPADMRADMESKVVPLLPLLKQAFVDNCTKDAWGPDAITCHVDNKERLARFEKCSQMLTAEQRGRLESAVKAALSSAAATAPPAAGSGSGSGSAK